MKGVRSTFATAFNEWKDDVRYMANLAIVTNMKCWEHYGSGNEELEAEKSSTKEALEQCKKNHEAEIAHYKQMTQSAVSKREEIEAQLKAERKHLEELSASQDEKAKEHGIMVYCYSAMTSVAYRMYIYCIAVAY